MYRWTVVLGEIASSAMDNVTILNLPTEKITAERTLFLTELWVVIELQHVYIFEFVLWLVNFLGFVVPVAIDAGQRVIGFLADGILEWHHILILNSLHALGLVLQEFIHVM